MAKSTSVVVPPNAAARVPVSKSSLDVVPPNGISRCVCASIPPGKSNSPVASITRSDAPAVKPARTSLIFSPSTKMSAGNVDSAVTTVPPRISVEILTRPPSAPASLLKRCHALLPRFRSSARIHLLHRDAVIHRTHQRAQIATDAFHFIHAWNPLERRRVWPRTVSARPIELRNRRHRDSPAALRFDLCGRAMTVVTASRSHAIHMDALMCAIPTGRVAQFATDTLLWVNPCDALVIQVEILPLHYACQAQPAEIIE